MTYSGQTNPSSVSTLTFIKTVAPRVGGGLQVAIEGFNFSLNPILRDLKPIKQISKGNAYRQIG
jgi:hypothetical protein